MNKTKEYVYPRAELNSFTCPHCGELTNFIDRKLEAHWDEETKHDATYSTTYLRVEKNIESKFDKNHSTHEYFVLTLKKCIKCNCDTVIAQKFSGYTSTRNNEKFLEEFILIPEVHNSNLVSNEYLNQETKLLWAKACSYYQKDKQVCIMFLRICLESFLRNYYNEPKKMLGDLKKDFLMKKDLDKLTRITKSLIENSKDLLNSSHHSNTYFDFEENVTENELDLLFELINSIVYDLIGQDKKIAKLGIVSKKSKEKKYE